MSITMSGDFISPRPSLLSRARPRMVRIEVTRLKFRANSRHVARVCESRSGFDLSEQARYCSMSPNCLQLLISWLGDLMTIRRYCPLSERLRGIVSIAALLRSLRHAYVWWTTVLPSGDRRRRKARMALSEELSLVQSAAFLAGCEMFLSTTQL